jgi:DNA (cytosine-5)-methyltransferase 1
MRYLSVCSGIEAASAAWEPLGWKPLAFSEIDDAPRKILKHRFPGVPLHGDFTRLRDEPWIVDADVLVGGTPCQSFSVAGLRGSLSDERGNLTLEFVRLADAIDDLRRAAGREPAWIVWENVPGVLSTSDNAFGAFLGGLVGSDAAVEPSGGGWDSAGVVAGPRRVAAWRVLDAQYFGVAQRRRRIFVLALGGAGAWSAADALLPLIDSRERHPAPSREAGEGVAPTIAARTRGGGGLGTDFDCDGGLICPDVANPLTARMHKGINTTCDEGQTMIAHTLRADGFDASEDGTGRGTPLVPICLTGDRTHALTTRAAAAEEDGTGRGSPIVAFHPTQDPISSEDGTTHAMGTGSGGGCATVAGAVSCKDYGADATEDLSPTLRAMGHDGSHANAGGQMAVVRGMAVRRVTPVECERLQGFPDGWTRVPVKTLKKPPSEGALEKYADCYEQHADGTWTQYMADGPRYKMLGNSMAVPVIRYLGERIAAVTPHQGEG